MNLQIAGIDCGYGSVRVLKGVTLDVRPGEVHALLGRNGAGKTTTLKAIMGLVRCTAGSIRLGAEELTRHPPHAIPRFGVGYVPQGRRLFPQMTVEENLRMGLLAGNGTAQTLEQVLDLFPILRERLRQQAGTMSGGQQQMLAMGRALCLQPKVLLLDEPCEGLQPSFVDKVLETIAQLRGRGVAALLVEQKVDAALQVADRVSFLENGVLRHEALPAQLRSDPEPLHRYVGVSRCEMAWIAGVDVGGTFTDLIALESATGEVRLAKVPTTPENQAFGVLAALDEAKLPLASLGMLVHGTTTTTNALLERKLAKTGLITTKGFRDVLELGRRTRPNPYGLKGWFEPLIPRELRMEVAGRMDAEGEEVAPLDEDAVREAARHLAQAGCESLVIHFLHSYINPAHEVRAAAIAGKSWPNRYLTAGHTILSEYREYERGVTAAVNASVQPILDRYLAKLSDELKRRGFARDLLVMQGNGGTVSASIAAETAVNTVMSGPASGVIAAAFSSGAAGFAHAITYDMGGTSTDVGLVLDGIPEISSELEIEYAMPVHVPMVDVHTIGAGGGSIAYLGEDGMLKVGPRSAGANPGPICYGRGGTEPTITDANLVLGRLNPERLLGVKGAADVAAIRDVLVAKLGVPLGLDGAQVAAAIVRIANDRMAGAIRMVSLARGHDPRDFVLFPFGGAGPLHAAALARELGIPKLLIPARPGITNALGCVVADLRHDYVNTVNRPVQALDPAQIREIIESQVAKGRALLEREGVAIEGVRVLYSADMQFQGQSHMLTVALPGPDVTRDQIQKLFDRAYWDRFEVELPEIRAVLVNLHTAVIGLRPRLDLSLLHDRGAPSAPRNRPVWFADAWHNTPVYQRSALPDSVSGPAIIEQLDCTTVLEPGNRARVDALGNLLVEV